MEKKVSLKVYKSGLRLQGRPSQVFRSKKDYNRRDKSWRDG